MWGSESPSATQIRTSLRRAAPLLLPPAMKSSDYRPTKQQKRPTHEGIADDRTRAREARAKKTANDARSDGASDGKDGSPRSRYKEMACTNLQMANDAMPSPSWMGMANPTPGATSRPRTDDAADGKDIPDVRTRTAVQQAYDNERANPGGWKEWRARTDAKMSNDARPDGASDETAVQLSSGPTYQVSASRMYPDNSGGSCPAVSLREHLQGRE